MLTPGTRFGPYEIVEHLGSGGMGEVYRAKDTRLDRSVAIKVLGRQSAELTERMAREARAISNVSHPNICALYDLGTEDGVDYLVMEYLQGETLADRLTRGPLPLIQALRLGAEVAAALDVAHRAGLVHRDLKPANIMMTKSGSRLLDFGLAKTIVPPDSAAPTLRNPITQAGMAVGTLQYMSPEQLEGGVVDIRSDFFGFGCVLYEAMTGRRAFDATTKTSVMTAILTGQPAPPSSINSAIPPSVDRVIARCLEKEPEERWQSARDLAEELRWLGQEESNPSQRVAVTHTRRGGTQWWTAAGVSAAVIAIAIAASMWRNPVRPAGPSTIRFSLALPPGTSMAQRAVITELALSPDGSQLAVVLLRGGHSKLALRMIDDLPFHDVEGTDGAVSPFWSPDGKWLGFFAGGEMRKVPSAGGPVQTICHARGGFASWSRGGDILYCEWGSDASSALQLVRESGGPTRKLTDEKLWYLWPEMLAGGKTWIAVAVKKDSQGPPSGMVIGGLDGKAPRRLSSIASHPEVDAHDNIYYVRDGALVRQKLDPKSLQLSGDATSIVNSVFEVSKIGAANFSVSRDGSVIAVQRVAVPTQLVWRNRDGKETGRVGTPQFCKNFPISPDGTRLALELVEPATQEPNLWIHDLARGVSARLTSGKLYVTNPLWTHRGDALLLTTGSAAHPAGAPQLARIALADGSITWRGQTFSDVHRYPSGSGNGPEYPTSVTADDSSVIYSVNRGNRTEVEMTAIAGRPQIAPLLSSEFNQSDAVLSPDGRWLAYQSDDSGRPEVYVGPFGRAGERARISNEGGSEPRWNPNGRELFWITAAGMLMAVPIDASGKAGIASPLFAISSAGMLEPKELGAMHYDVDPKSGRFLIREIPGGVDEAPITVIVSR